MGQDNRLKFTETKLEKIPPAKGLQERYYDTEIPGLALYVSNTGRKVFYVYRRVEGKPTQIKIGGWPSFTVDRARTEAQAINVKIDQGKNPQRDKQRAKEEPTFSELFSRYIERRDLRLSTREDYAKRYKKHMLPFAARKVSTLSRVEIRAWHEGITEKHGPYAANRSLVVMRAVLKAAIDDELIPAPNPADGIRKNQEKSREVRLLPSQIGTFFEAVEAFPDEDWRDFFTLLLMTGQRKTNVLTMKWADVYLEDAVWVIPGDEFKNGSPHQVPLFPEEIAILKRRREKKKGLYVFPGRGKAQNTGTHLSEPWPAFRLLLQRAGIPTGALHIHDLRRTLGSVMADNGDSLPTIGKALGHKSPLTTAIYARLSVESVREAKGRAIEALNRYREGSGKVVDLAVKRTAIARADS